MSNPQISVVIPAYNAQNTIVQTIQAVLEQDFSDELEVIVIDDGSIDATAEKIKSFSVERPYRQLKYIYQNNAGPAAARNRGAQEAKGSILFFTDSDCVPQANWIKTMLPHLTQNTKEEIAAVSGSYGIANPENLLARCIHREILFRHHHLLPTFPKVLGSYNFCVKRKIFEEVKGFDVAYRNASGEDNHFSYKILQAGYKIYFEKESLVDHYHTVSLKKYLYEQYRHGYWRARMYRQYPAMLRGDDYTFWKDIIEVPLVVMIIGFLILSAFFRASVYIGFSIIFFVALWLLDLWFGMRVTGSWGEGIFFGSVMFFRAFARTSGFFKGCLDLLSKICSAPKSKTFLKIITSGFI